MKILFKKIDDNVVMKWERKEIIRKEKGIRMFGKIIMKKKFMIIFIRKIERKRYL
jgi:hypothetical protein